MEEAIKDAYLNPKNPCAFSSIHNVLKFLKPKFGDLKYEDVERVLENEQAYTMHKPNRERFTRRKTTASGVYTALQIDLADMSKYKKQNDNITFLLVVIDVYSRRLFVKPLKSKGGVEVCAALTAIFDELGGAPIYVYSDDGKEFYNSNVQELFKKYGVRHCTPKSAIKCSLVERANRTIKTRLAKYMTHKYNHR